MLSFWLLIMDSIWLGHLDIGWLCVNQIPKQPWTLLKMGVHRAHRYAPIVNHITRFIQYDFIQYDWNISFQHTLREGNVCADWLAKHGANSDQGCTVWSSCSPQLSSAVLADALGVLHLRI